MSTESRFSRREFLAAAAPVAALPLVIPSLVRAASESAAPIVPAGSGGGIGSLHVFSKPLHDNSYEETAQMIAAAGFEGIDYAVRHGGHVVPEQVRDDLPRAVAAARAAGLKVEMIATDIVRADDPHTIPILETAAKLGITSYRLGRFKYDVTVGIWESLQRFKSVVRELAQLNERYGLHGAIQNHAGTNVGGAIWDIFELVRDLDPRWIGCQYDIRHATVEGAQSWPITLQLIRPWVRSIDVKDFRWGQAPGKETIEDVPIGEGVVDFAEYFRLVRELKISGPCSVHFEYPPFEGGPALAPETKKTVFATGLRQDFVTLDRLLREAKLRA
jgi:L-ribulose-5-phosphate 3-epimerase